MTCNDMNAKMADLLFEAEETNHARIDAAVSSSMEDGARSHLAGCDACRRQLEELRTTMALLDSWEVAEPNPYFLTRLNARLEEEREAAPASWFERLRARFVYGSGWSSQLGLRPVAAMALTVVVLISGGAYLGLNNWEQPAAPPAQAAVVHDLQTLDNNAQLLDQLESLSSQSDD